MEAIFTILGNVLVNMGISHYTKNIFSTIIQSRVIQLIIQKEICPYFPQYLRKDFETFQIISNGGYKVICELFINENGRIILKGNFTMWHIVPYSISRPWTRQLKLQSYNRAITIKLTNNFLMSCQSPDAINWFYELS